MNMIFEDVRDWWDHQHGHHTSAAQAAVTTKGTTMSASSTLHNVADAVEHVGEEGIGYFQKIAANPLTAPALKWLATMAGLNANDPLLAAIITKGIGSLEALHIAYTPAAPDDAQTQQQATQQATAQQ